MFTDAAGNLLDGSVLLKELFDAEPGQRPEIATRLKAVEHAGDDATHAIFRALNTSFITPFDRDDIAQLAGQLDDVLDAMEAAADLSVLYQIQELPSGVDAQIAILHQASELTVDAMPRLATLQNLDSYWITINDLENQADQVYRSLLADLFNNGTEPLRLFKIKEVVDQLEEAADAFEHVANVIQSIAAKES
ncbi:DUF47 domain-containing protein [Spelaeicoccus albus]|uniref:Phosphate transport regulator n=1 Tax=Spelaeicoccus albus TaxID=1280376 RepID=A0A7Z0IJ32_9MICO|nr:DUF47 family protein [Spelaeicoccus albus]NYI69021.1 hypothetical protein [Spelaeicoccus albus]